MLKLLVGQTDTYVTKERGPVFLEEIILLLKVGRM